MEARNQGDISVTDEGEVTGIDETLTALLDRYPYLAFTEAEPVDDDTKALQDNFPVEADQPERSPAQRAQDLGRQRQVGQARQ